MTRPKVKLVDAQTGEEIIREMNDDEFAKWQEDKINFEAAELARANADATKAALLAKLGITEEEARLLLG
jgi:Mg/Co/Ni transporter MgtE